MERPPPAAGQILPFRHWSPWGRHLTVAALALSAVCCVVLLAGPSRWQPVGNVWIAIGCLATTVVAFRQGGARARPIARRASRLIAAGQLLQVLGQLAWGVTPFVHDPAPYASMATLLHLLATLPTVLIMLLITVFVIARQAGACRTPTAAARRWRTWPSTCSTTPPSLAWC